MRSLLVILSITLGTEPAWNPLYSLPCMRTTPSNLLSYRGKDLTCSHGLGLNRLRKMLGRKCVCVCAVQDGGSGI